MKNYHNIAKNFLTLLNFFKKEFLFVLSFLYFRSRVIKILKAELLMSESCKSFSIQPNNSAGNFNILRRTV